MTITYNKVKLKPHEINGIDYSLCMYRDKQVIDVKCEGRVGDNMICDITVLEEPIPLGVSPKYIFEEEVKDLKRKRIDELGDAVQRYMKARIIPKTAWLDELEELRKEVE